MSEPILTVQNLTVRYDRDDVIRDFSLSIAPGECVAVVGPNGSGKTTLLRALSGHLLPASGRVRFFGQDISRLPPWRRSLMGLVHVLEGGRVFPSMSVEENLRVCVPGDRTDVHRRLKSIWEEFPDLAESSMRYRPASALSGGERQLLVLARAELLQPKLLLLDSPFLGIGARFRGAIRSHILTTNAELQRAVLLVDHDLPIVDEVAHRRITLSLEG